jgi:hypothetical protein
MSVTNFPNGVRAPLLRADGTAVPAIVAITNNSGGTASNTIAAIGATYTQAEVRNAVSSLHAKIEELRAALVAAQVIAP